MHSNICKPLVKYGKVVLFIILAPILLFVYPFYWARKYKYPPPLDKLDEMLAKYGTKYTDGFFSRWYGYDETKFEEVRQWTAAYGDEEARKMYREKYCNDKKQENSTTSG